MFFSFFLFLVWALRPPPIGEHAVGFISRPAKFFVLDTQFHFTCGHSNLYSTYGQYSSQKLYQSRKIPLALGINVFGYVMQARTIRPIALILQGLEEIF